VLIVCGYAFILLIDRVIIDSHQTEHAEKDHALESSESVVHDHEPTKCEIPAGQDKKGERSGSQIKKSSSMNSML